MRAAYLIVQLAVLLSALVRMCLLYQVGTNTSASSRKIEDFGPKNGQMWSKKCIFGHFGPNIGIFVPFRPMPDQKQSEQGA